jgi:hypothetical protein
VVRLQLVAAVRDEQNVEGEFDQYVLLRRLVIRDELPNFRCSFG